MSNIYLKHSLTGERLKYKFITDFEILVRQVKMDLLQYISCETHCLLDEVNLILSLKLPLLIDDFLKKFGLNDYD